MSVSGEPWPVTPLDPGFAYAVLAALLWGTFLYVNKRYFPEYPSAAFMAATFALAAVWHLPVTIERRSEPVALSLADWAFVAWTVLALAVGLLLLFRALGVGDVSYVAPISKTTPAFVVPIEVALLGQRLSALQVGGVVLATLAVYVANYRGQGLLAPLRTAVSARPAQLALASAATLGVLNVSQRVVLQEIGLDPMVWLPVKLGGAAVLLAPVAVRTPLPDLRADLPKLLAAGALLAAGEHAIVRAFDALPASLASPVVSTQAIVAVLLGGVLLGEKYLRVRLAAAAVAALGVVLIAAA
jgi:drug/metabolite transporter (DMT)-like permease